MIRFCDGEVELAGYDLLSRRKLVSYFLNGQKFQTTLFYYKPLGLIFLCLICPFLSSK